MRNDFLSSLFHRILLGILLITSFRWQAHTQIPTFPDAIIVYSYNESKTTYVQKDDTLSIDLIDIVDRGKLIPGKIQYQHYGYYLPDGQVAYRKDLVSQSGWYDSWMTPPATVIWTPDAVQYYDLAGNLVDEYIYTLDSIEVTDPGELPDPEYFGYDVVPGAPSPDIVQGFSNAGINVLVGNNGQWSVMDGQTTTDFDSLGGTIERTTYKNGLIESQEIEIYKPTLNGKYFLLATQFIEHEQWQNNVCVRRITSSNFSNHQVQDFRLPGTMREMEITNNGESDGQIPKLLTNPIGEMMNIQLPSGYSQIASANVFDAMGRVIHTFPTGTSPGLLTCTTISWPPGMYTVSIVNDHGEVTTLKAIKK